MKVRFTEEQIIKILKEHEGGKKAVDIVRESISQNRLFTVGKANMAAWTLVKPSV
ncbi:putative transposase orfA for insertion sequence element [Oscillibacter valericigenes Sjm18-20]|nr:putative transposase orfA for insertion sequence element [Oscillibacter valericigenes Sjm18-20]BAL01500.1 putative transposase orfA for insertion sequence element [Oscillibacter valericigenes Sjm18-20]